MSESVKPFSKLYDLTQRAEKVGISDDDVLREILVEKIVPNKYQPRREFTIALVVGYCRYLIAINLLSPAISS